MKRKPRRPRLYFSLRSPYSWLAITRLRNEVPGALDEIECLPYWDPDERTSAELTARGGEFHYVQMSRAKHLYMLMDTKRIAQKLGLAMAWPVDIDPWWELPHLAWLLAREHGLEWQLYDALTEARWGRGENICEPDVLRKAAEQAGLDPELAVRAPEDERIRDAGASVLYQAYLDDIFGIPYFKFGQHRFWGLDRLDAFLEVWKPGRELSTTSAPQQVPEPTTPYEIDSPGGCG